MRHHRPCEGFQLGTTYRNGANRGLVAPGQRLKQSQAYASTSAGHKVGLCCFELYASIDVDCWSVWLLPPPKQADCVTNGLFYEQLRRTLEQAKKIHASGRKDPH